MNEIIANVSYNRPVNFWGKFQSIATNAKGI